MQKEDRHLFPQILRPLTRMRSTSVSSQDRFAALLPKGVQLPTAQSSVRSWLCGGSRLTGKPDKVLGKTSTTASSLENEALNSPEIFRVWQFASVLRRYLTAADVALGDLTWLDKRRNIRTISRKE